MQPCSCIYGEKGVCVCLYSHFCSSCSYPATCQHFSLFQAGFTDVQRKCSWVFQGNRLSYAEMLSWELSAPGRAVEDPGLTSKRTHAGSSSYKCQKCKKSLLSIITHVSVSDQFSLFLINHLIYLGNDTYIRNGLHDTKS